MKQRWPESIDIFSMQKGKSCHLSKILFEVIFQNVVQLGQKSISFFEEEKKFNRFFKRKNCQEKIFDRLPKCALADWRRMIDLFEENEDRRQRSLS